MLKINKNAQNIEPETPNIEETIADLGYIKRYAQYISQNVDDSTLSTYANQIYELANKVYERHFAQHNPYRAEETQPDPNQGFGFTEGLNDGMG